MDDVIGPTTPGLVCAHHHLYSALARGMPAPPRTPSGFTDILELVWWRLDRALDLETIRWSAMLGALEALERGCTAIIDHHESPEAIEGSLDVIAEACATVGIRVSCAYGSTDRHGPDGARRGLAENERCLRAGGRGMVGVHAAFTCTDESLEAAAGLAADLNVGVHVHVAEGKADVEAADRLRPLATDDWLLIHGVHLDDDHGLAGTDGIGADMLDEFRLAYVRHREDDVTASPEDAWGWLAAGWDLFPEAHHDRVTWDPVAPVEAPMDPWRLAFTTGVAPRTVEVDGEVVLADGRATRVDAEEIRARAAEQAAQLHQRLDEI